MSRRYTRAAAAIGIAFFALVLWRTLAHQQLTRTATSDQQVAAHVALAPGGTRCQAADVPAGTGAVSFAASGQAVRLTVAGRTAAAALKPQGRFAFLRLPTLRRDRPGAVVCFTDIGAGPLLLYGDTGDVLHPNGPLVVRIDWFRPSPQRRWSLGPTVASRLPLVKSSLLGPWTLWLALAAALLVAATAISWSLRGDEP